MRVMVDICIVPVGVGVSVSQQVAECQRVIRRSGLVSQMHAYGTNIEGEWDEVFAVIKECHHALHDSGVARISSSLRIGTRTDKTQTIQEKIQKVEDQL